MHRLLSALLLSPVLALAESPYPQPMPSPLPGLEYAESLYPDGADHDPAFRAAQLGALRILENALILGPGLGARPPVPLP